MRHSKTPNNRSRRCKVIPTDLPKKGEWSHGKPPGIPVAREKGRHSNRKCKVIPTDNRSRKCKVIPTDLLKKERVPQKATR